MGRAESDLEGTGMNREGEGVLLRASESQVKIPRERLRPADHSPPPASLAGPVELD